MLACSHTENPRGAPQRPTRRGEKRRAMRDLPVVRREWHGHKNLVESPPQSGESSAAVAALRGDAVLERVLVVIVAGLLAACLEGGLEILGKVDHVLFHLMPGELFLGVTASVLGRGGGAYACERAAPSDDLPVERTP